MDHFAALAFVTLADRTGRLVAAWHAGAVIDDRVNVSVRFAAGQRRETVLRNALYDLAQQMAKFRPHLLQMPIAPKGGSLAIADPSGAVPMGVTLPVLRPAGRFAGVAGPVMVPVGQVTTGGELRASLAPPTPGRAISA
jgi:hypothetical protein